MLLPLALSIVPVLLPQPEEVVARVAPAVPGALESTLTRVRQARAEHPELRMVIELDDGRYELEGPLTLGPGDSGLVLRPAPGARPVLSAGKRVTGWRRDRDNPALWTAPITDEGWGFAQLFVGGQQATRARTPNEGFFQAAGPLGDASPIVLPFRAGDIKPEWAGVAGAQIVMLQKWTDLRVPILGIDAAARTATVPGGPRPFWMDEPDARYWVENVPDALDTPGEWYLDPKARVLSYLATAGAEPDRAQVVAPAYSEVIRIEGAPGTPVRDIHISGITCSDSDYEIPEQGLISPQAAVPIRGAVRVTYATGLVIEDCTFRNLGGYAIDLGRGVQGARVVGNTITSIGAGGVRIGEPDDRQPTPDDECRDNQVTDNEMTALGRVFAPACGVIIFQSHHNVVAHNRIADLFYTGISVGWTWGYTASPCHHNTIEYNIVEHVGQKRLSDMGGIYTLGPQEGTVVRCNIFRDVQSYRYGGWGLYTDEGSTGIVLEKNVAVRCTDAGFHQHYGRDNIVRNNILAFNEHHAVMRTRDEEHRSFEFTRNIIVQDSGALLGSNWNGGPERFISDSNVWFDRRHGTNAGAYVFAGAPWDAWRSRGHDAHSRIADPLLIDPERPELGVKPGSPAFEVGFEAFDLTTAGPRARPARR